MKNLIVIGYIFVKNLIRLLSIAIYICSVYAIAYSYYKMDHNEWYWLPTFILSWPFSGALFGLGIKVIFDFPDVDLEKFFPKKVIRRSNGMSE